jgi:signal peptidase I
MAFITSLVLAALPAMSAPGTSARSKATSRCCCSWRRWSPASTGWPSALYFLPRARARRRSARGLAGARNARLAGQGITQVDTADAKASERLLMQPWWLDWTAGLFPVILVVFLLRSFLYEPFKIPSGSMMPTLLTGDLILVNKFTYGLRLPVINTKITDGTPLARGDVVVFRYPPKPSMDYIKRVVGIPGDEVAYLNKKLTINGQPVSKNPMPDYLDGRFDAPAQAVRRGPRRQAAQDPQRRRPARPSSRAPATFRSARTAATPSKAWSARCRPALLHDGRQPR